jgi:hypothetical protein
MNLTLFTNWAVGAMNGYTQKENGLPNGIKYGTIGITTFIGMCKTLGNWDTPIATNLISTITPRQKLAGLFIGAPLIMAANFCVGHHMGKAIRFVEDSAKIQ